MKSSAVQPIANVCSKHQTRTLETLQCELVVTVLEPGVPYPWGEGGRGVGTLNPGSYIYIYDSGSPVPSPAPTKARVPRPPLWDVGVGWFQCCNVNFHE